MEAKDTVLKTYYASKGDIDRFLLAQAEISFNAGIKEERDRVHIEINKMLEPLKLHLSWITGGELATEQYGLADDDGDDIDIGVIVNALEAWEKGDKNGII